MKVTKKITRPVVERTGAKFTFKRAGGTLTESAHKRLKESSLRDYDFAGLNSELRATLPADYIDNHNSDLYVKKTPESTEILKKYGILGHPFCKTFNSQTPPLGIWYDIAFAYVPNSDGVQPSLEEDVYHSLITGSLDYEDEGSWRNGEYVETTFEVFDEAGKFIADGFARVDEDSHIGYYYVDSWGSAVSDKVSQMFKMNWSSNNYIFCSDVYDVEDVCILAVKTFESELERELSVPLKEDVFADCNPNRKTESLTEDTDEILVFKRDVNSAEDVDDIQYAIQKLSDGVAEDALQSAFNEADGKDIDEVKNAVITALDVYLEDNEWLGESFDVDSEVEDIMSSGNETHPYRMLSRLQSDFKYLLGSCLDSNDGVLTDSAISHALWCKDISAQADLMRKLYDRLDEKPEWISIDTINGYEETALSKVAKNESIKESSDEDKPYSYKEVEQELKSLTNNFTQKSGELKCGFEEEKNHGVKILKKHYEIVEVSGDDRREGTWYHIEFSNPKRKSVKESAPLEDRKPYRVFAPGDRVVLTSNKWHTDSQNDNIGRKGTIVRDYYHGAKHGFQVKADDVREVSGYEDTGFNAYDDELDYAD